MEFNPFDPKFRADPYPTYARLREEAPVFTSGLGFCAVSRYDDITFVLKNPQIFSSKAMGMGAMGVSAIQTRSIIGSDPPDHTLLRNLVNRAFTPRMVVEMEPRIREIARELLGQVVPAGRMDLVEHLGMPLPVIVIAEILGIEPSRRADFKRWSDAVVGTTAGGEGNSEARYADVLELRTFFEQVIDERRRDPKDDLISALIRAEDSEAKLTNDEILGFAMLLLIAGNETTTNLIGNAMLALLAHPDQLQAVAADGALIPNMVEEALRYDAPVQFLFRTATEDVEIAGTKVPANAAVVPIFASGNRDSRRYPDGERFDITRNAQGHLAFGLGPHFCLGAPLARLEARVAFEELFARIRDIERAGDPTRIESPFLRGLHSLPLSFTSA